MAAAEEGEEAREFLEDWTTPAWHLVVADIVERGGDVRPLRAISASMCYHTDSVLAELAGQHRTQLYETGVLAEPQKLVPLGAGMGWHGATLALALRALYESDVYPGGEGCATLSLPRVVMDEPSASFWALHDFYVPTGLYEREAERGEAAMVALSYPFLAALHVLHRGRLLVQILQDWQRAHAMHARTIVGFLGLLVRLGGFAWTLTDPARLCDAANAEPAPKGTRLPCLVFLWQEMADWAAAKPDEEEGDDEKAEKKKKEETPLFI